MITVLLQGGLGNQMFQYAYARALQLELNTDLFFDISFYETRKERELSLLKMRLIPQLQFKHLPKRELYLGYTLDRISRKFAAKVLLKKHFLFWPTIQPYPYEIVLKENYDYKLFGYWQDKNLFEKHSETIKHELEVISDVSSTDQAMIESMNASNSVCIHIRRGDYIKCNFIVCDIEYYQKAISIIQKKIQNPVFYVFSDDVNWVKANIGFPENCKTVFADETPHQNYEILRLMYNCKHFIMSNSTFSWWGQYLSKNNNRIVIAPKQWLPDGDDYSFMYDDTWIKL